MAYWDKERWGREPRERKAYPQCQTCGSDGGRGPLIFYYPQDSGEPQRYCQKCHPAKHLLKKKPSDHQLVPWADPKIDKHYTVAKDEVIQNQVISPDDGVTVVDKRRPNEEAPY